MKTPGFWARPGGLAAVLAPWGVVTRIVTARRLRQAGYDALVPVICVGNAGTGGAGKTLVVLDLLARLPGAPFALTRGYGGQLRGPVRVAEQTARQIGDEALLLAAVAPAIVARDRAAGAKLAVAQGASAIVMDDGLQNPGLKKTLSLLVIDGGYGFGNGKLLPAGPLREPVAAAAARCQAAVLIGPDRCDALAALPPGLPVLRAELEASCETALAGRGVVAFAGIGRPEKFFTSVEGLGGSLRAALPFPDHHRYTASDARRLARLAQAWQALLVTTAKDFVKLPPALARITAMVRVRLVWQDEAALQKLLEQIV